MNSQFTKPLISQNPIFRYSKWEAQSNALYTTVGRSKHKKCNFAINYIMFNKNRFLDYIMFNKITFLQYGYFPFLPVRRKCKQSTLLDQKLNKKRWYEVIYIRYSSFSLERLYLYTVIYFISISYQRSIFYSILHPILSVSIFPILLKLDGENLPHTRKCNLYPVVFCRSVDLTHCQIIGIPATTSAIEKHLT